MLGHKVSFTSIEVDPAKEKVIAKLPLPVVLRRRGVFWAMLAFTRGS